MTKKQSKLFEVRKNDKSLFLIRMKNPEAVTQINRIYREYRLAKKSLHQALQEATADIIGEGYATAKKKRDRMEAIADSLSTAIFVSVFLLIVVCFAGAAAEAAAEKAGTAKAQDVADIIKGIMLFFLALSASTFGGKLFATMRQYHYDNLCDQYKREIGVDRVV